MKTWILFVSVVLISICAAAGCVQPTQQQAEAELCQNLDGLEVALQKMQDLNVSSSVGDIRAARDDVKSAMEDVRNSAGQLAEVRIDKLNAAYDDLDQTVQKIPDDATIVEALQTIRPKVQAVRDERQQLSTELNCTAQ